MAYLGSFFSVLPVGIVLSPQSTSMQVSHCIDIEVSTAHYSPECALDTAVNTVHTGYLQRIQCAMHSKHSRM